MGTGAFIVQTMLKTKSDLEIMANPNSSWENNVGKWLRKAKIHIHVREKREGIPFLSWSVKGD